MTEPATRTAARCEDCKKLYRVPDPEHAYQCTACGGAVRALAAPEHSMFEGTITCPSCHAVNHEGHPDCSECGALLRPSGGDAEEEESFAMRHQANTALKAAYTWIGGVTWLYRLGALAYAIATLFAVLALIDTEIPREPGVLVVGLMTLLSVLMLMGAINILFKPFLWTLAIASLATIVSVIHLVGPNPLGLAFYASATIAALTWAAVVPTLRFRRLIDKHRDLYIIHHASLRTRRALKGRSPEDRHERLLTAMRRAAKRAWRVSTAAAAALVLASSAGTYTVLSSLRPNLLSDSVEGFEAAWNDSDLSAVAGYFDPAIRAGEKLRLMGFAAGHGWGAGLPPLEEGSNRREGNRGSARYEVAGLPLSTSWVLRGQDWFLTEVKLPVPPLEPVSERFQRAWRSSDPAEFAQFFTADSRARLLASIEDSVRRRGWDSFPRVIGVDVSDYSDGQGTVTLSLEKGVVTTEWLLRSDGTWGLSALRFPRR